MFAGQKKLKTKIHKTFGGIRSAGIYPTATRKERKSQTLIKLEDRYDLNQNTGGRYTLSVETDKRYAKNQGVVTLLTDLKTDQDSLWCTFFQSKSLPQSAIAPKTEVVGLNQESQISNICKKKIKSRSCLLCSPGEKARPK